MKRQLLGAAFAVLCSSSFASSSFPSVYVSAELGRSDFDVSDSDLPSYAAGSGTQIYSPDVDSKDLAKAFSMGFRPVENVAVDVGYLDLGEVSATYEPGSIAKITSSIDGFTLGANLLFPAYRQLTVFARAGMFHWKSDARIKVEGSTVVRDSEDGDDPFIGAGFLFGWDNLKFRAGYTRYEVEDDNVDVFSGGLQYFFPAH